MSSSPVGSRPTSPKSSRCSWTRGSSSTPTSPSRSVIHNCSAYRSGPRSPPSRPRRRSTASSSPRGRTCAASPRQSMIPNSQRWTGRTRLSIRLEASTLPPMKTTLMAKRAPTAASATSVAMRRASDAAGSDEELVSERPELTEPRQTDQRRIRPAQRRLGRRGPIRRGIGSRRLRN